MNSRGDVKYIYDTTGALLCEYEYDAWGGIVNAVQSNVLAYAGCAGITAVDGPLPIADIVAAAAVSVLAIAAVGQGINAVAGAAMTTIEALNATGVVYAVKDGAGHVSVHHIGGTLEDWHNAGSSSVWTQAVKSVVVKWDWGK